MELKTVLARQIGKLYQKKIINYENDRKNN